MNKKKINAVTLLYVTSQEYDTSGRKLMYAGDQHYADWFLEKSVKFVMSESLYQNVIINNPQINAAIMSRLFPTPDDAFNKDTTSDFVYFYFDRYYCMGLLDILKESKSFDLKNKEYESFIALLMKVVNNEIVLIFQYHKKYGWFDYKKALEIKREVQGKYSN